MGYLWDTLRGNITRPGITGSPPPAEPEEKTERGHYVSLRQKMRIMYDDTFRGMGSSLYERLAAFFKDTNGFV
ncbi:MAG: hypothetical protein GXP63_05660 [DPANN group archaeon]|nr:hypothetical protein [DPANN group archaeon]